MKFNQALASLSLSKEALSSQDTIAPLGLRSILSELWDQTDPSRKRVYSGVIHLPDTKESFQAPLPAPGYPADAFQELKSFLVKRDCGFWIAVRVADLAGTTKLSPKFYNLECPGTKVLTDTADILAIRFKGHRWNLAKSYDPNVKHADGRLKAVVIRRDQKMETETETELNLPQLASRVRNLPNYGERTGPVLETIDEHRPDVRLEAGNGTSWSTHLLKTVALAGRCWTASGTLDASGVFSVFGLRWDGNTLRAGKRVRIEFEGRTPSKIFIFSSDSSKQTAEEVIDKKSGKHAVNLSVAQCFEALEQHADYKRRSREEEFRVITAEGEFIYYPGHHASILYEDAIAKKLRDQAHVIFDYTAGDKETGVLCVQLPHDDWMVGKKMRLGVEYGKVGAVTMFSSLHPEKVFIRYNHGNPPKNVSTDLSVGEFLVESSGMLPAHENSLTLLVAGKSYTIPEFHRPNHHLSMLLHKLLRELPSFEMQGTKRTATQKRFLGFPARKSVIRNAGVGTPYKLNFQYGVLTHAEVL